jgi:DNA polymerase III alpha subunit
MWTENNTEAELIEGVMTHGPDILDHCITSDSIQKYFDQLSVEHLLYPTPKKEINSTRWFIPREYQEMDIEEYVIQNSPKENYDRVVQELQLFKQNNMIPVLKTMKYIVDTLRKNNVIWGVGRGSSVASYVLHIIGVHKIDSIKYNIPIEEFFKGENNG